MADDPCNIMFLTHHWFRELDIASVNHMLSKDLHVADTHKKAFKVHCGLKEVDPKIRKDAQSIGVELCLFDDLPTKLPDMDIVVCHYPQTHEELFDKSASLNENVKQIFFVHSADDKNAFKEFASGLAHSDYVFFTSDKIRSKWKKLLKSLNISSSVYLPSCPLEIIPAADSRRRPDDNAGSIRRSSTHVLGYTCRSCSAPAKGGHIPSTLAVLRQTRPSDPVPEESPSQVQLPRRQLQIESRCPI